jgi:hypothetical protein
MSVEIDKQRDVDTSMAQGLLDLWEKRYQEWADSMYDDEYLAKLLSAESCAFCRYQRRNNPPEDPYRNCRECAFIKPCFRTYSTMQKKINGRIDLSTAQATFDAEKVRMHNIFKEVYGGN